MKQRGKFNNDNELIKGKHFKRNSDYYIGEFKDAKEHVLWRQVCWGISERVIPWARHNEIWKM